MKKALFTTVIVLLALTTQAQFKVHDDGHVSIGSLTKNYGIQVQPNCYTSFRVLNSVANGWQTNSISGLCSMKHWIVSDQDHNSSTYGQQVFYVNGSGTIWAMNHYTIGPNHTIIRSEKEPINKEVALSSILQLQGYYYEGHAPSTPEEIMGSDFVQEEAKDAMIMDLEKRDIGLDVSAIEEAIPDAVRTDPEARLCINYNAVITMLVEAVKQQQEEIEFLRKTLLENGLLNDEK